MVDASSPGQPGAEGSMAGRAAGRTAFGSQAEGVTPGACGCTAATGVTGITSVSGGCPLRDRCDAGRGQWRRPGMIRTHSYDVTVAWTGNRGSGTCGYREYGRDHEVTVSGAG